MLFNIDESVADLFYGGSPAERDFTALKYLAMGIAEGSHRITGRRVTLGRLASLALGDSRLSRVFARARDRVSTDGDLCTELGTIAEVVVGQQSTPTSITMGKNRKITIPLAWFDSSAKIQPCHLLAENIDDVRVALVIGKAKQTSNGLSQNVALSALERHGGGSSIGAVLATSAIQANFCLCLVDSDKAAPGSAVGQTAQTVRPFSNETSYPLVQVINTKGRDLENALPDSFYETRYGGNARSGHLSRFLVELTKAGEHELRLHLDVERGVTLFEALGQSPGSAEQLFWQDKLGVILNLSGSASEDFPCLSTGICAAGSKRKCQCILVGGNPSNILRDFSEHCAALSPLTILSSLTLSTYQEWMTLGAFVLSWCCADSPIRL